MEHSVRGRGRQMRFQGHCILPSLPTPPPAFMALVSGDNERKRRRRRKTRKKKEKEPEKRKMVKNKRTVYHR